MKYTVTVPPTAEMGSYKTTVSGSMTQTYRQEALQDYNSCRAHDGLPPVKRMPAGTTYTPVVEYVLQGNYGYGDGCLESCSLLPRRPAKRDLERERLRK